MLASAAVAASLATASPAWGSCFTIYSPQNTVVYQSGEPPIDLSRSISSQMAARYPRHHMVMVNDASRCPVIAPPGRAAGQRLGDASGQALVESPLFRDASPMMTDGTISGGGPAAYGSFPAMTPGQDVAGGSTAAARPAVRSRGGAPARGAAGPMQ